MLELQLKTSGVFFMRNIVSLCTQHYLPEGSSDVAFGNSRVVNNYSVVSTASHYINR